MSRCAACKHDNRPQAKFCDGCGARLSVVCPACGTPLRDGALFCDECGNAIGGAATPITRELRSYTPRHLADKILQSRYAIEGERKHVTVLFADIKNSTELTGAVDPEEWHAILERFFEILTDGVHRFEGTVNQYTGDGIMALFGAPIAHEDHAQRACYAALQLRDELRRYSDELRLDRGIDLATRIGLNSGEVVVGKIGDDLRMDYTAQGQVVNVAQRMEQLAESGCVYLAQQTADRVAGFFRLREVGHAKIKGVAEPALIYELLDSGEIQNRFDVARTRGLSKFVGREREMAQLEAALERGLAGSCRFVGIVAEPGTGKSRLVYEFSERCRQRGLRVVTSSCPPHGASIPMHFHLAGTRWVLRIEESDDIETSRRKVAGLLSQHGLAADVPFMLDVLGLETSASQRAPMDAETRQREWLRILSVLLPVWDFDVFVAEDLHWIDAASDPIRVQLSRIDLPNRRFKVYTYRPEYRPAEADWPEYEEIRLKPFSAESTAELLHDLLGADPSVKGLGRLIQERAAGNPFFVEEIVNSLVESGQLDGARSARRLVRAIDTVDVPDSVQAVLAARIDRLDERAKTVLQAAAVVGLEFPVAVVEAVTAMPRRDVEAALQALTRADFTYQLAAYPEIEYAFKHPLTQQVAYDTQLREHRRRVHAKVAHLLEQRHSDKLDEKSGLIAYHWQEAGERIEAARWHGRAAGWLESRNIAEALQQWRLTRSLLGPGTNSPETGQLAMTACLQILSMGWRQGISEAEAADVFAEGTGLARASGDARAHALFLDSFASYQVACRGQLDEMLEYNGQALEFARSLDDPVLTLGLEARRLFGLWQIGRPSEAIALWERAWSRVQELDAGDARMSGGFHLATSLELNISVSFMCIGRLDEARTRVQEALTLARRHHDVDNEVFALEWLAGCCVELGDLDAALSHARDAVSAAEQLNSQIADVSAYTFLGSALLAKNRWQEAADVLERTLVTARERSTGLHVEAELLELLAAAHLELGQTGRAQAECLEAIAVARRHCTPQFECDAQLVLARCVLRGGAAPSNAAADVDAALDRAEELVGQIGAEFRRPRLLEVRAGLAYAQGDAAGRDRLLREARRLYTNMGAKGHAERLARTL